MIKFIPQTTSMTIGCAALRQVTQKVRRIFWLKNRLALVPPHFLSPFVRHAVTLAL